MKNDEVLLKSYTINSKEYIVINELDINGIHYLYMSNEDDPEDIMIRKIVNGYLEPLDSEQEIIDVMKLIVKE